MRTRWIAPVVAVLLVAACSSSDEPDAEPSASASIEADAPSNAPAAEPAPSPAAPAKPVAGDVVLLRCGEVSSSKLVGVPRGGAGEAPNFVAAWADTGFTACRNGEHIEPTGATELAAYEASGYSGNNISTLYELCGAMNDESVYFDPQHVPSQGQISELTGVITLCPEHPQRAEFDSALSRGANGAPSAGAPAPTTAGELSAGDERFIRVLALEMVLADSPDKQLLCDAYVLMGADLTATQINGSVSLENQFPVDVVQEVFDGNC